MLNGLAYLFMVSFSRMMADFLAQFMVGSVNRTGNKREREREISRTGNESEKYSNQLIYASFVSMMPTVKLACL